MSDFDLFSDLQEVAPTPVAASAPLPAADFDLFADLVGETAPATVAPETPDNDSVWSIHGPRGVVEGAKQAGRDVANIYGGMAARGGGMMSNVGSAVKGLVGDGLNAVGVENTWPQEAKEERLLNDQVLEYINTEEFPVQSGVGQATRGAVDSTVMMAPGIAAGPLSLATRVGMAATRGTTVAPAAVQAGMQSLGKIMPATLGIQSAADQYGKKRSQDVAPLPSLLSAGVTGGAEYGFERISTDALLKVITGGADNFVVNLGKYFGKEIATELPTTVVQTLADLVFDKDVTPMQAAERGALYLNNLAVATSSGEQHQLVPELVDTAAQTAIQVGMVGAGGRVAGMAWDALAKKPGDNATTPQPPPDSGGGVVVPPTVQGPVVDDFEDFKTMPEPRGPLARAAAQVVPVVPSVPVVDPLAPGQDLPSMLLNDSFEEDDNDGDLYGVQQEVGGAPQASPAVWSEDVTEVTLTPVEEDPYSLTALNSRMAALTGDAQSPENAALAEEFLRNKGNWPNLAPAYQERLLTDFVEKKQAERTKLEVVNPVDPTTVKKPANYPALARDARALGLNVAAKNRRGLFVVTNAEKKVLGQMQSLDEVANLLDGWRAAEASPPLPAPKVRTAKQLAAQKARNTINPASDDLLMAIRKLGGLDKAQVLTQWGKGAVESNYLQRQALVGKPVLRNKAGLPLDRMLTSLKGHRYLPEDASLADFEEIFLRSAAGEAVLTGQGDERAADALYEAEMARLVGEMEAAQAEELAQEIDPDFASLIAGAAELEGVTPEALEWTTDVFNDILEGGLLLSADDYVRSILEESDNEGTYTGRAQGAVAQAAAGTKSQGSGAAATSIDAETPAAGIRSEVTPDGDQLKMFATPSTFGKKAQPKGPGVASLDLSLAPEEAGLFTPNAAEQSALDAFEAETFTGQDDERDRMRVALNDWPKGFPPQRKKELIAKYGEKKPSSTPTNTVFTEDAYQKAKALMQAKLNQLSAGIDPELMQAGFTIAGYHIEKGTRSFTAYAAAMVEDFGDKIKPYLKSFYNGVRDLPGIEAITGEMDSYSVVAGVDVAELGAKVEAPLTVASAPKSAIISVSGGNNRDDSGDGGTGAASVERDLSGSVSGPQEERAVGRGNDRGREVDGAGNEDLDAQGDDGGTGRLAGKPAPLYLQEREAAAGAVSLTTPPVSEPRGLARLAGDNPGNYRITAATRLGAGTRGEKIAANLAAIRLIKELDAAQRYPTLDEQHTLARYVGWGGLKSVFDPSSKSPQDQKTRAELENLLSKDELFEVRQSVLNAHYTSGEVIGSIYAILEHMGFTGGHVLEPTYGSGNFIGLMPERLAAGSKWYGSELDLITAKIGQYLYPDAQLLQSGFQDAEFPYGKFDLAIGNPPFGAEQITDTNKKRAEINRFKIHNYVIAKSGLHLRPGGVLAMVVTNRFLDTENPEARDYLAKNFKFLTAIRLPNDAFAKNAGTEVVTDLVFFQRALPGEDPATFYRGWLETGATLTNEAGEAVKVNRWFAKRPELMLGVPSMSGTMYGRGAGTDQFTLTARPGQDTTEEIAGLLRGELLEKLRGLMAPTVASAEATATSIQMNREDIGIGGYVEENGTLFMRVDDDAMGNPTFIELNEETIWSDALEADGKGGYTRNKGTKEKPNIERFATAAEVPASLRLGKTRLGRIKGMMRLRAMAYDLIEAERFDLPHIEKRRTDLNDEYDEFVKRYGFISEAANATLMAEDVKIESGLESSFKVAVSAARAKTLNTSPQKAMAVKASILKQRVFFPSKEITTAENGRDGYNISLAERGKLDLDYIAGLVNKSRADVIDDLAAEGLIFRDPESGEWLQEDAYLSGNVKEKLRKVQGREGYERNVEELTKKLPADVAAEEIFVDLGATWVPAEVYQEFAELLGVVNPRVMVLAETGAVKITAFARIETNDLNVLLKNPDFDIDQLFNSIANKQSVVAYDVVDDGNGGKKRVVNKDRTKALAPIVKRLAATFRDWVMADPQRASHLAQIYNETQNTHAPRLYNGKHLKTVGASPAIRLRNSQRNAAWRMMQAPVTLLDHVVGAGKTFTIITGVMERKRLGLSQKPMIVVPNHLVGQWAADFLKLYPGARILAATKKDFEKKNRRRLFARIATGNFDAVIVGHSSFGFIPIESATHREFLEEEVSYLERALYQAKDSDDKRTVRNITEQIAKKREKINELLHRPADQVITFEAMGVDNLVVDESHEFKNLEYSTSMQNITGMGNPKGAKKSFDLYAKIQYLRGKEGAVTFATGTPISNSLVEMYTVLRYLNRPGLKARKLDVFDAWAKTYALIEPTIEYTSSQKLKERQVMSTFDNLPTMLQLYTEFADVISMKDLKRIYADQIREMNKETGSTEREEFPIPQVKEGGRTLDIADPTAAQREYMEYLVARADRLEKLGGKNDPKEDNHLWLMNDARKMALDIRLVDPLAPSDPANKINRAAGNIKRIYDRWHGDKGTQMVFCDLSTPTKGADKAAGRFIKGALTVIGMEKDQRTARLLENMSFVEQWGWVKNRLEVEQERLNGLADEGDEHAERREKIEKFLDEVDSEDEGLLFVADTGFSVYDDLKGTLVKMGVPVGEIAFIHDANSDTQKSELFSRVNSGDVRILIGSSKKMGAGTNAQERLVGMHHMDAPWRPSDVEQREGRIIRQGNVLYERDPDGFMVEITAYSTRQTFDAVMWQILARKAGMLDDFRAGAKRMTEEATDSAGYAEFMAESTGNPIFREKFRLEKDLDELESTNRNIAARRQGAERMVRDAERLRKERQRAIDLRQRDLDEVATATAWTVDGKEYRDDLTTAVNTALEHYRAEMVRYDQELPAYIVTREQIEVRKLAGELTDKEAKELMPKKPVQPTRPGLARLEKSSQAAAAALRVSELLDDAAVGDMVAFSFGGAQATIEKAATGGEQGTLVYHFKAAINGVRQAQLDSVSMHMSENKLMALFSTGSVKAEVTRLANFARNDLERLNRDVTAAQVVLDKLTFTDAAKLETMRHRYQQVLSEVKKLEDEMTEKRAASANRYMQKDGGRFAADPTPQGVTLYDITSALPLALKELGTLAQAGKESLPYLITVGQAVHARGVADYQAFVVGMKAELGALFERFKGQMLRAWHGVLAKVKEERGSLSNRPVGLGRELKTMMDDLKGSPYNKDVAAVELSGGFNEDDGRAGAGIRGAATHGDGERQLFSALGYGNSAVELGEAAHAVARQIASGEISKAEALQAFANSVQHISQTTPDGALILRDIAAHLRTLGHDIPNAGIPAIQGLFKAIGTAWQQAQRPGPRYSTSRQTILAGDSGLGKVTVTPAKSLPFIGKSLAKENAEQVVVKGGNVEALRKVAQGFGKNIIFFRMRDASGVDVVGREAGGVRLRSGGAGNAADTQRAGDGAILSANETISGFINPAQPNLIFLNVDAPNHLLYIAGHEVGHALKMQDQALWAEMEAELQPLIRNWSNYRERMPAQYETLSESDKQEELLADVIGHHFLNEKFWSELAQENKSLFTRIAKKALELLNKALRLLTGLDVRTYISDMTQARAIIAKTLLKYGENVNKGMYGKFAEQADLEYLDNRLMGQEMLAHLRASGFSEETLRAAVGLGPAKLAAAWHGSPHDHDKFSTEKIGTGEGAQAYGYGLYFAESRNVAEHYQKMRSDYVVTVNGREYDVYTNNPDMETSALAQMLWEVDSSNKPNIDKTIARLREGLQRNFLDAAGKVNQEKQIQWLERNRDNIQIGMKGGKLYQVELAPAEDEYLLWDRPLSEQSAKVQVALRQIESMLDESGMLEEYVDRKNADFNEWTGAELVKQILPRAADDDVLPYDQGDLDKALESGNVKQAVSAYLHSIGIRGIKYLDGTSRGKGAGNYNYVIFHEDDVAITAKYAIQRAAGQVNPSGALEKIKNLLNPLDYARLRRNVEKRLPPEVQHVIGFIAQTPYWKQAEADPAAKPFYVEGRVREEERMDYNVRMRGGMLDGDGKPVSAGQKIKDWFNWNDDRTAWEEMKRQQYYPLSTAEKSALDLLVVEGDARRVEYSSLAKALQNPALKAAGVNARVFTFYRQLLATQDRSFDIALDIEREIMEEMGWPKELIDKSIAQKRELGKARVEFAFSEDGKHLTATTESGGLNVLHQMKKIAHDFGTKVTKEKAGGLSITFPLTKSEAAKEALTHVVKNRIRGRMHRNHGEGMHNVAVHRVIEKLDFDVRPVALKSGKPGAQFYLPFYPGRDLAEKIEEAASAVGGSFLQQEGTGNMMILVREELSAELQERLDQIELRKADGTPKHKVMVYSRYVATEAAAEKLQREIAKDYKKALPINYRAGDRYETTAKMSTGVTEEEYGAAVTSSMALDHITDEALRKAINRGDIDAKNADTLLDEFRKNVAEELLARGAGAQMIRRAPYLIEGYERADVVGNFEATLNGTAGMLSKAIYAMRQYKHMKNVPAQTRKWATSYVAGTLRNMARADRLSGDARALASLWYLGFNALWMAINHTQPYVFGVAELSRHIKGGALASGNEKGALRQIAMAEKDLLTGGLSAPEKALWHDPRVKVQIEETVMAEMAGSDSGVGGRISRGLHTASRVSMAHGHKVEVLNRKMMILAAYRTFRQQGQEHGAALQAALEVNSAVNIDMGRYNLPGYAAHSSIGRTMFALQSFIQHAWQYIYYRSTSGQSRDQKAILRLLFAMALLGGLPAGAPGSDELDDLIMRLFGYSPKLAMKGWLRKEAKEYGTVGELLEGFVWRGIPGMLGGSVTGNVQFRIPVVSSVINGDNAFRSLGGAVGGLATKGWNAAGALEKGNYGRALEYAAPTVAANVMSGIRQATEGVKTSHGKPVFYKGQPLKMTKGEAAVRALGMQPSRTADISEVRGARFDLQAQWNEKRQLALDRYRMSKALKHVQEFNKELRGSQAEGLVNPITVDSLRQQVKPDKKLTRWERDKGFE